MNRSSFLQQSALAAVALAIPWIESCKVNHDKVLSRPDFLMGIADKSTIHAIGKAYVIAHPDEDQANALATLLTANHPDGSKASSASLVSYMKANIDKDFREGRTVTVIGWVLSQTEARQCALLYLTGK